MNVFALPGFLGQLQDWQLLNGVANIIPCELWDFWHPSDGMWAWAKSFNEWVKDFSGQHVLMGYSLGGRLAMHALVQCPGLWAKAILVSANPGLQDSREKEKRLQQDEIWAKRFEEEPWDSLMNAWSQQSVFEGHVIPRKEEDFSRDRLAAMLRGWSLGKQDDLSSTLKRLHLPILWVTGQQDTKYTQIASSFSPHTVIPHAGHRVPWQQPDLFQKELLRFIRD